MTHPAGRSRRSPQRHETTIVWRPVAERQARPGLLVPSVAGTDMLARAFEVPQPPGRVVLLERLGVSGIALVATDRGRVDGSFGGKGFFASLGGTFLFFVFRHDWLSWCG